MPMPPGTADATRTRTTPGSGPLPSPPHGLAKFGCARCRQHHLKCDRVTPTCGRCVSAQEVCRQPGLKIREPTKHKFKFAKKQKWVKTPKRLIFVDESQNSFNDASSPDSGPDELETGWDMESPDPTPEVPAQKTPSSSTSISPFRPTSPPDRLRLMMISSVIDSDPPVPLELDKPPVASWPLDLVNARLFRHFVANLSLWLDLCDPNHTFEIAVPREARRSPVLLNAIFALSARHLGQTRTPGDSKNSYNQLADMYNEACITMMSRLLKSDDPSAWTEILFAATIILQVMEEMNAALGDEDDDKDGMKKSSEKEAVKYGHLPGMYRFVQERSFEPGTLGAASFWVGLRQEIYSAVTKRRPVCLNLAHPGLVDRSRSLDELDETDDYAWANLAVIHCADVLNFCFGSPHNHHQHRREELERWNRTWSAKHPLSYEPVFKETGASNPFPEIWYHRSCQVIGVQHHRLAKLFLLDYQLQFGCPLTAIERHKVEEQIRETVREVCGIGRGNQWTPPGVFTACMAISAFGDYFRSIDEQDAMLTILKETQDRHARPTESARLDLLRAWGRQR